MSMFVQASGGSLKYTFEWADVLPTGVTFQSVDYETDLTIDSAVISNEEATSTIQVSGIQHGGLHTVKAIAHLSNSELVPSLDLVIRGFNS